MASTLQLEFAQAMSDFKTMFPDMERDVIEAVLRANQVNTDFHCAILFVYWGKFYLLLFREPSMRPSINCWRCQPIIRFVISNDSILLLLCYDIIFITTQSLRFFSHFSCICFVHSKNEKLRNELEQSASPSQRVQNKSGIVEEDLIVPLSSTTVSTPTNRVTGASPKVKCPSMPATSSAARPNSSNTNRWDPPMLGPLPPTFLRLTPNEVSVFSANV